MRFTTAVAWCGLSLSAALPLLASDDDRGRSGAVYTMTNSPAGNAILIFNRAEDGTLSPAGSAETGGLGTGAGLGNQGGVTLSDNNRWLLAVNAQSNDVSLFEATRNGLTLSDRVASGGMQPISVAIHGSQVYVLNAASDNIVGFRLRRGKLTQIPGSTRPLSGNGVGPAQVGFSPDGELLIVTEKNTNRIVAFKLEDNGARRMRVHASSGQTPFGFSFGKRDHLFISEAFGGAVDASAISSYEAEDHEEIEVISPSVGTTETAACWVVVTKNGRYLYTTNTGSGSVSGYRIASDGRISLLNANGVTGSTGPGSTPIDAALSEDSRFLYVLASGNGSIVAFRVNMDGSLTPLGSIAAAATANGLAAR